MNPGFKKVVLYVRIITPMLIIGVGLYCLIFPERLKLQDIQTAYIFGGMVLAYGLFRGYRAYKDIKRESE